VQLTKGKVAVVTGAASGIGRALASRFGRSGLDVVLADVDEAGLASAAEEVGAHGVATLTVRTDVSDESSVQGLAAVAVERFGGVHLVCNNAGVETLADPWFGPLNAWEWVLGVNFWGVVYGVRTFLPLLLGQGEGHIVNTASMAGLVPGTAPSYDASKHAVVAMSEDLYVTLRQMAAPVGVSVLCPGWVRTNIMDAARNWPTSFGDPPAPSFVAQVIEKHVRRAIDEGMTPAAVADVVADAVTGERFWVFPHPEFVELAVQRWERVAAGENPSLAADLPGLPPTEQIVAEVAAQLAPPS